MRRAAAFVIVALAVACASACGRPKDSALCGPNGTVACGYGLVCTSEGCAQCGLDADCSGYATTQLCLEGTCVECEANEDCDVKSSCWADHQCHDPCTTGTCPGNLPICATRDDESNATCLQCQTDADCSPSAPRCDYQLGTCVTCLFDSDCASPTPKCLARRCVECERDSDCPGVNATCTTGTFVCTGS